MDGVAVYQINFNLSHRMIKQEGVSALQLSRMKERLAQVEEMIRNSQMEFTDAITVRNISGRNLHLTLNITDRQHPHATNQVNYDSRINVPNNSTVNHQITRHAREYFSHSYNSNPTNSHSKSHHKQSPPTKHRQSHQSPDNRNTTWSTVQRSQQKFQSTGSRKKLEGTIDSKKQKDGMIMILDEDTSDIEEESKSHRFNTSELKNSVPANKDPNIQTFGTVNMNDSNVSNIIMKETPAQQPKSIQKSPQVFSYLHQQIRQDHPEINTSFKKHNQHNHHPTLKTPDRSKSKEQAITSNKKLTNILNEASNRKSQNKGNTIPPHEITTHKKKVQNSKDNRSNSKSKPLMQQQKSKIKAQQLYMQRKQGNLVIEYPKHISNVERRYNRFVTANKNRNDTSQSKRSLSPKVQAVTQRLYVRKKSPCGHYRHFSQSQERQRFLFLVEENPMVSKYIGIEQREQLFQQLRNDPDSVSLWPMKLVNYASAKIQKSCSVDWESLHE